MLKSSWASKSGERVPAHWRCVGDDVVEKLHEREEVENGAVLPTLSSKVGLVLVKQGASLSMKEDGNVLSLVYFVHREMKSAVPENYGTMFR